MEKPRVQILWPRRGRDWLLLLLGTVLALGILGKLLPESPSEVQVGVVRLKVPAGWEVREVQGGYALLSPLEGGGDRFRENLTLLREPLPQPLSTPQYAQVVAQRNAQGLEGFVPGKLAPVRLGNAQAVAFSARGSYQGRPLEFLVYAFVLGQEGYQITLTAEPGKLTGLWDAVQGALATVQLPPEALAPGSTPSMSPGSPSPIPAPGSNPWEGYPAGPNPPGIPGPETPFSVPAPESSPWGEYPEGPYGSAGDFWESWQEGENFNTWMAEEWSQLLSGETPEPTYQDEAGNLYWEGPSGLLHEWGDYSNE